MKQFKKWLGFTLAVFALILGLWLKVEDKKKGYGLELPNIK